MHNEEIFFFFQKSQFQILSAILTLLVNSTVKFCWDKQSWKCEPDPGGGLAHMVRGPSVGSYPVAVLPLLVTLLVLVALLVFTFALVTRSMFVSTVSTVSTMSTVSAAPLTAVSFCNETQSSTEPLGLGHSREGN